MKNKKTKEKPFIVEVPIYAGITKICRLFDVGHDEVWDWMRTKKVRYSVSGTKRAKRRIFTQDVIDIFKNMEIKHEHQH